MGPWVQNLEPKPPRWRPGGSKMEAQWPKMEARRGPNVTQRASEKHQRHLEHAKSMPRGVPESPGPARARFCVRFWGPKGAEREPKSHPKANKKRYQKDFRFRSHFGTDFYRFGGPKASLSGHGKEPNRLDRAYRRRICTNHWENPGKTII